MSIESIHAFQNAEPTAEEAAKQAADLAATKAAVAHEETVSSLRGQGMCLAREQRGQAFYTLKSLVLPFLLRRVSYTINNSKSINSALP